MSKLQLLLAHTDLSSKFDAYGIHLYKNIVEELGWDEKPNELHLNTLLRSLVLNRMVSFNDESTVVEAKRRFELIFH